ncbi:hypothetical protein [Dialister invisus]|jgi:hypothetical protein|uniref:hypothetical protein n=1 Tax=Dialister invisus TaxID=218538 RepID=UPI00204CB0DB|nr:hypothetical protein [Dialister invisus]MBS6199231.1 hypothetical protein [Dialister invisus]DAS76217.1 MAG TPA: Protein of unknown function (DUF3853) [Caudoviricetes sp.]
MEIALLSKEEARRLLKISRSTFWRLEKKSIIRPVQSLLPTRRYRLADIEKLVMR